MSLVPQPGESVDPRAVADRCDRIDAWSAESDDVNALHGALAGLAAIDEYLDRVSIEGRERVAASMLRLKVRIGKLLGPAKRGGDRGNQHTGGKSERSEMPLDKDERHEFRKLAEHEDIVEKVIAESSDDRPATTQRALHEIRKTQEPEPRPAPAPRAAPRERDAYDIADNVFTKLAAFVAACETAGPLDQVVLAGLDASLVDRQMQGGIWLQPVPRALELLGTLRNLQDRPLRSVQ